MSNQPTNPDRPYYVEQRGNGWSLCVYGKVCYWNRTKEEAELDAKTANDSKELYEKKKRLTDAAPALYSALVRLLARADAVSEGAGTGWWMEQHEARKVIAEARQTP